MTTDELHTLAHQIAYDCARSDIESFTTTMDDRGAAPTEPANFDPAHRWNDLSTVIRDDFEREAVAQAIFYLNAPLPEPAGDDHKALVACEFVLEHLARKASFEPNFEPEASFKRRVVAWLAEKYLDERVRVSGPEQPSFPVVNECTRCGKHRWHRCADPLCVLQGSANG